MEKEVCEITMVHEEDVAEVTKNMPDVKGVANIFKALADETRLQIVFALSIKPSLCVCDVAAIIHASTATASHHLRYLKELGLAKSERKGKLVYYALDDEHVEQIVQIAYTHFKEVK